ncbi:hypothetical protein BS1321_00005 [Peribacillus simplex NBRC 15720 = DSM 1321]|uniref:Uncharacterized protein n=1 Tax=Peribacillus simplex NBRC 15720 = DSM 1321 TaxID=1349754 RepID=A0A223EPQ9_9BACI|nr:hypothetical protein BS1321_00005 [Peribacillus simplex NBRC 15720 = DSM 1321]
MILYVITYVLVVATLTVHEVKAVTWPTISFIQSYEVKGIFIERLELFLLITWILQFFCTHAIYYYFAAEGLTKILKELRVLLSRYAKERQQGEHFGDFCHKCWHC